MIPSFLSWCLNVLNIRLNELKLKYNVIGRKIKTKTRFLNQDSARIDPISFRIKGYSFSEFEDNHWHSPINVSVFSQRNLTFKLSVYAEIDLEEIRSKILKDCGVKKVRLLEKSKNDLHRQRTSQLVGQIRRNHWIVLYFFNQWPR